MVIFFTYPIFVIIFAWFFSKEQIHKIYFLSVLMILLGIGLISNPGTSEFNFLGVLYAILSAILYALYVITSKKLTTKLSPLTLTLVLCYGCSTMMLVYAYGIGAFTLPNNIDVCMQLLCLSVIGTVIPILFLLQAFKYISAMKASIISVLEPVTVVMVGALFLEEILSGLQIIGIIVILTGAIIVQFDKVKR